ncbi:MAG: RHS repeat-associated core domain-containing protein, partial [Syntrophomonadaceae bacterium]
NVFTYTYLSGTQLISGYTAINPSTGTTNVIVSRNYELNRNLITAITNAVGSVYSVVSSFDYNNDSTGKRTSRIDYYNSSILTNTFGYNVRDEVTNAVMNLDEQSIVYDDIGNRQTSTVNSITNGYASNQLNQYTVINGGMSITPTHDFDGNLTWDGSWRHIWNGENRPVKSVPGIVTNGTCMIEYRYNHQNLRVEKIKKELSGREAGYPMNPHANPGTWNPIENRRYIWDGFNIAAEIIIDHVNPATNINYYTWGIDLSGTLQGAGGVGGLLSDIKVSNTRTNSYYALSDANGNITEYVDISGTIVAHGKHNAFGETKFNGLMKDYFTHWFSSKPFDPATGFVSFEQRYYKPPFAMWLSRDIIGERGGWRLYGFVGNNGVNGWDYLGLLTLDEIEALYRKMVVAARKRGANIAADNLEHFLAATGTKRTLDWTWLRSFNPVLEAEKTNTKRFENTIKQKAKELVDGGSITIYDYWDSMQRASVRSELYYASGTFTVTSYGVFLLRRKGRCVEIEGDVDHYWWDPYDWHVGLSAYIPGFGNISDADALRLQSADRASSFIMDSEWSQQGKGQYTIKNYWFDSLNLKWRKPRGGSSGAHSVVVNKLGSAAVRPPASGNTP